MRILILGDCHGQLDFVHQACMDAQDIYNIKAAIQVGDFGFFPKVMDDYLRDGARRFPVPLHVIDGNHEDHKWLHQQRKNGHIVQWQDAHIYFQERGSVATFDGLTIGFIGGALHADRRQEWADQWEPTADDQTPVNRRRVPQDPIWANWVTLGDVERALHAFNLAHPEVIITHSCPAGIGVGMGGALSLMEYAQRFIQRAGHHSGPMHDCGEGNLARLWFKLTARPRHWLFGHFHTLHTTVIEQTRFQCVGSSDDSDQCATLRSVILDTHDGSVTVDDSTSILKRSYKKA